MSTIIRILCDVGVDRWSTCGENTWRVAATVNDARNMASRDGWHLNGRDLCPRHSGSRP